MTQNCWGNEKTSWGNDSYCWGNEPYCWGNDPYCWGNEAKLLGKWSKIVGEMTHIVGEVKQYVLGKCPKYKVKLPLETWVVEMVLMPRMACQMLLWDHYPADCFSVLEVRSPTYQNIISLITFQPKRCFLPFHWCATWAQAKSRQESNKQLQHIFLKAPSVYYMYVVARKIKK